MSSEDYDVDLVFGEEPKQEFYEDLRKALLKKICGYGGPISRGKLANTYVFNAKDKKKANNIIKEICSSYSLEAKFNSKDVQIKSQKHQNPSPIPSS